MAHSGERKIRVTFVLPSFSGGGAERVVLTLARHLDRDRFSPFLVVLDAHGALMDPVPDEVPITDLKRPRLRQAWPHLAGALRDTNSDIIVPTISHINLAVLMLRGRLGPKTRIIARESNTPSASLAATRWPALFRGLYRWFIPRADAVLCPSQRVATEFHQDYRIDRDRLVVLPHPVDLNMVRRHSQPVVRAPGKGQRFVAAGRMTRQKGFDRLIDLFPTLSEDAHLTLLGEGGDLEALKQRAARLGVLDRIAFPGFSDNPWAYFAGADAFLLPSRWEGMPNATLEALGVGVPVIARSEAGGVTEIGARTGSLTIVDSDQEFAAAMRNVQEQPGEVSRPSLLPERFTLDIVMTDFEEFLAKTAGSVR
jgi:glycosyltransferase involved in cell wall biosynthesis